ncbi:ATPase [Neisseria sp. N95_16]|uniref:AAA family ATPase n=1 Tax=Neisseria brasiliensis TaxID=2666100 RepID=A0A7X2H0C3_9NEIS|nr:MULTISPECIES: AAA family ATPase [Neisseria]MRN38965.1 AAA family ATPase [Neisseria brasiliensis]MRN39164.1 AAA family ATPase [Neisseria brasiliensis]PJO08773.1 ATPase [Neisseria sp. N95_16]
MKNQINKALQQRFIEFKERSGLSQSQLARAIGSSVSQINMYLKGNYAEHGGKYETVEKKIETYLDVQESKAQREELNIGFVSTPTMRRIMGTMLEAHEGGEVVVIYGQAGLGKTQAVKRYCEKNPTAILIEANPSFNALVLMRKLATACKLVNTGSLNDLFEAVADRLRDSGRLIVVDEAENLPLRALEILRRLHDETGCGLVLSGMPKLVANLRGKHGELVQLYSRVSRALPLGDSLPDEELAQIAQSALPEADAETVAEIVKQSNGNTRRMSKLMRGAVRTANKNGIQLQAGIVKKYSTLIIR